MGGEVPALIQSFALLIEMPREGGAGVSLASRGTGQAWEGS